MDVAQIVEPKRPEILFLFLGLGGGGFDNPTKVG
jgi:hypothetical protein